MDPAEDQQVMILRQVVQRPDNSLKLLVAAKEAKNPDQSAPRRDVVEDREFFCEAARRTSATWEAERNESG